MEWKVFFKARGIAEVCKHQTSTKFNIWFGLLPAARKRLAKQ